jgi:hypothetical protein
VGRNRFNINRFEATEFRISQQGVQSGSGPGGRWFKSIRPDHFIPETSVPDNFADFEELRVAPFEQD